MVSTKTLTHIDASLDALTCVSAHSHCGRWGICLLGTHHQPLGTAMALEPSVRFRSGASRAVGPVEASSRLWGCSAEGPASAEARQGRGQGDPPIAVGWSTV